MLPNSTSQLHRIIAGVINGVRHCAPTSSPTRTTLNIVPTTVSPERLTHVPTDSTSVQQFVSTTRMNTSVRANCQCTMLHFISRNPNIPPRSHSGVFRHFCATSPSHTQRGNNANLNVTVTRSIIGTRRNFVYTANASKKNLAFAIILPVRRVTTPRPGRSAKGAGSTGRGAS